MGTSVFLDPTIYLAPLAVGILVVVATFLWLPSERRNAAVLKRSIQRYGVSNSAWLTVQGKAARNYFDADLFLGQPEMIGTVVDWVEAILEEENAQGRAVDRLVFIERRDGPVGAVTLKDLLSWKTEIPAIIVRPSRRGPAARIKGLSASPEQGPPQVVKELRVKGRAERGLLISDVATTGTAMGGAIELVREAGGVVDTALVLYDRLEGAEAKLAKMGVRLLAMGKADADEGNEVGADGDDTHLQ